MKNIEIQTQGGEPVVTNTVTVQPVSQAVSWIGKTWGFVWNRPYAVRVEQGETTYQIPIRDYTQTGFALRTDCPVWADGGLEISIPTEVIE